MPVRLVTRAAELAGLGAAVRAAARAAIDTETCFEPEGRGPLRVLSAALRDGAGAEQAWVVDVRDLDPAQLAPIFDGVAADAWNATFDARVTDDAVFGPAGRGRRGGIRWWDCQLADAVLHQGMTGFGWYHSLAWACERYLGVAAEGKGTIQLSFTERGELSAEQVAYAAADAVETLWIGDELRRRLARDGLEAVAELEMAARPLLDHMERAGLPIDWASWAAHLAAREHALGAALGRIAELTGGGQGSLFSPWPEPTWNPGSEREAKAALNRWAAAEVHAYTAAAFGAARPLDELDTLDAAALREIGGPLAAALVEQREHAKILSTYGANLAEFVHPDGRIRPQYVQVVGVNTGRLASRRPNAQNLAPEMKPHLRPGRADRVFVCADLSQAELRWLAQVSGDQAARAAFAAGADIHVRTAERMFEVDMAAEAAADPLRWAALRSQAKTINFGIVYGLGPQALSRSLTLGGMPTTLEQARRLLDAYLEAFPGVAAWLAEQDRRIASFAASPPPPDWPATLALHAEFGELSRRRREFRQLHRRWPSPHELAEPPPGGETEPAALAERAAAIARVLGYEEAVVLVEGGAPLTWCSYTLAGRRRQFNVHTDRLLLSAALIAARSAKAAPRAARDSFAAARGVALAEPDGSPRRDAALTKVFEDRELRRAYVDHLQAAMGPAAVARLLDRALAERITLAGNAFRNAPIQGGVADAMLAAYALVWERLADREQVAPVQTVHDSIVLECPRAEGPEVARLLKTAMEEAFARFCPDVAARADADVRTSLAEADVIERV
ncbi:MAG: DNA polymerase [Acidimicrobiales bacterium]